MAAAIAHNISGSGARLVLRQPSPWSNYIASERNKAIKDKLIEWASHWAYQYADSIVAISKAVAESVINELKIGDENVHRIYNPVDTRQIIKGASVSVNGLPSNVPIIIGVGSLGPQKDFETLVRAFARIRRKREAHLCILGEGGRRRELEKIAKKLNIHGSISMPGFVGNPFAYMQAADVFALSSKYEGFGNVLVEAMTCGTPVVSTDCPGGPSEILAEGVYGELVPVGEPDALAKVISEMICNPTDSQKLKERAKEFDISRVKKKYQNVLVG
ncbi:glycosyltransferase involved in cell wall biosynthesis [Salinibacter ruber]|nr:glycosyltransferase involved in cell wall biosynthesis [Salinibacter ruber]